jgi:hypothetical protein
MPQTPELHRGLDPQDWSATLELGHRMLDEMITWLATSRDRRVWRHMPQNLRATLREKLPQGGQDPDAIYGVAARFVQYRTVSARPCLFRDLRKAVVYGNSWPERRMSPLSSQNPHSELSSRATGFSNGPLPCGL